MTVPRTIGEFFDSGRKRLSEIVSEFIPKPRFQMSPDEADLAVFLRGNEALMRSLVTFLSRRIEERAKLQEPSDPLVCKSWVARDRELQWLLARLEFIYRSPVTPPGETDDVEQPQ